MVQNIKTRHFQNSSAKNEKKQTSESEIVSELEPKVTSEESDIESTVYSHKTTSHAATESDESRTEHDNQLWSPRENIPKLSLVKNIDRKLSNHAEIVELDENPYDLETISEDDSDIWSECFTNRYEKDINQRLKTVYEDEDEEYHETVYVDDEVCMSDYVSKKTDCTDVKSGNIVGKRVRF